MLNIGLTTSVNYGRTLLTSELEIVTAHEIGHNWGSSHDPDNSKECAPSDNFYIMYPSAVDGTRANNKNFSPCSRASIGSVIKYKSSCFEEASDTICGNSIVEGDEECDPGRQEEGVENPCCTRECKLRPSAQCSDGNALCCTNCQFASTNKTCYVGSDFDRSCNDKAYCTGINDQCGDPLKKAANSSCYDEGECDSSGECRNYCEAKGLYLCSGNVSCHWNCMDSIAGVCDKVFTKVADGKSCKDGSCVNGTCIIEAQDTQTRIWTIISGLDSSTFVKWMGNNIILVTVILSLVLWVPVCLLLRFLDDQHDEVDYVVETLRKKKELYKKQTLKTQMSSVSANSFEMTHVFNLTGEKF